jgi:hypothetical protein
MQLQGAVLVGLPAVCVQSRRLAFSRLGRRTHRRRGRCEHRLKVINRLHIVLLVVGKRWRWTEQIQKVRLCDCGMFARELRLQARAKAEAGAEAEGSVHAVRSVCLLSSGKLVCSMRNSRLVQDPAGCTGGGSSSALLCASVV